MCMGLSSFNTIKDDIDLKRGTEGIVIKDSFNTIKDDIDLKLGLLIISQL